MGMLICVAAGAGEWLEGADMNETRQYPGLALLSDGRVLAVTGHPLGGQSLASAEIYDPVTDAWKPVASMHVARNGVQPGGLMTLPSGRILLSGSGNGSRSVHEAEVFNPESLTWQSIAPMTVPRCVHATVQLLDGRVLVTGGIDWLTNAVHPTAETFDEATGDWTPAGTMSDPRTNHSAVRLKDGRVMVMGGARIDSGAADVLTSVDFYVPTTNAWTAGPPMLHARRSFRGVLLADGRVLVVAGMGPDNNGMAFVEVYDPATNEWKACAPLQNACWGPTATLLPGGKVLVTGGMANRFKRSNAVELYDPATDTWTAEPPLNQARNGHRAIVLTDGRVLVAGGFSGFEYLSSCEIYVPD
jgi:hypothetical protein